MPEDKLGPLNELETSDNTEPTHIPVNAEPLKNNKYEKFAQALVDTNGDKKATMKAAGYEWNPSYFSILTNKQIIKARVLEIRRSVQSDKILNLQARLELLSDISRDPSVAKRTRIAALHELYVQCGDAVSKVNLDVNSTSNNIVRYVEVCLPPDNSAKEDNKNKLPVEINDGSLDDINLFLSDNRDLFVPDALEKISKSN